ncbi:MAG: O-antigen ligase family protein [Myxococcota bacterium]|nr:O-antigen ligase family protein [Myxococcota bacterium]
MLLGLAALMLFNYGFQMVRIPPSGMGVPYIELLLFACTPFLFSRSSARQLLRSSWLTPVLIWQVWGGARILADASEKGLVAVRDGLPVLESIFFFVGFALFTRRWIVEAIVRYMPMLCWLVFAYAMTHPFSEALIELSPKLMNFQNKPVPVFFKYINTGTLLICSAAYLWVRGMQRVTVNQLIPGLFVTIALIFLPSRTMILQAVATVGFFILVMPASHRPRRLSLIVTVLVAILGLVAVTSSNLQVAGRLGVLELSDYTRLIQEMDWRAGSGSAATITSGTADRLMWWTDIIHRVNASWMTLFLGLGYGEPLINFYVYGDVVVREPHNTLMSVFGRLGIIGLVIYLWMTISIIGLCIKQVRRRMLNSQLGPLVAFIAAYVVTTLVMGIGESPFINPFNTVPYFFGVGILACMDSQRAAKLDMQLLSGSPRENSGAENGLSESPPS